MIESIKNNNKLYAIIVRQSFSQDGVTFFTENNSEQQLAYMKHNAGKIITPHYHNSIKREINSTMEVLFIKNGKLRVDFYNEVNVSFNSTVLNKGDVILLSYGGHGFEVLEDLEMFEIKQGPFLGDLDKVRFNANKIY